MGEPLAIWAEGLGKRFGDVQALTGVDLQVPSGRVLGLLGPNGAGKTTAVRILTTLLPPDTGHAQVTGLDVVRQASQVRRVIGLSGQYAAVDSYLTGQENLRMIGRLSGLSRVQTHQRADELLELFEITHAAHRTVRTYSGGMRRRLDVAASLIATPQVLFLDEPTTGLDPRSRVGLWRLLADLTSQGTALLLTTQYLEEADRLADTIVVMNHGQIVASGTSAQLKSQIGGNRLDVQATNDADLPQIASTLSDLGSSPPIIERDIRRVILPTEHGISVLSDVADRLATADIDVGDVALRKPTLDDVFLALTDRRPA